MKQVSSFLYQGNPISFDFGDNHKMINATEMANPFGLKPAHFLRMKQTKAFITVLKKQVANSQLEIVKVTRGGFGHGTWMHEKLALKFAAWLSPEFELWVFDRIQELLLKKIEVPVLPIQAEESFDFETRIRHLESKLRDFEFSMKFRSLSLEAALHAKDAGMIDVYQKHLDHFTDRLH